MNYEKIYNDLIESRKITRDLKIEKGYERHHIIPECLDGKTTEENLVKLTYREHYIAHWILTKLAKNTNEKIKLELAFSRMSGAKDTRALTSIQYERLRKLASKLTTHYNKTRIISEETKKKISDSLTGKKLSEETKAKMRESAKNRPPMTEETKRKLSDSQKGKILTEEHKQNISEGAKNRPPISEETRKKLSEAGKKRKFPIKYKKIIPG